MDWEKCLLCQQVISNEKLECPAEYADRIKNAYTNIVKLLTEFNEIGCLPPSIKLSCMDGGSGLEKTFLQRKAKIHKRCKLTFNQNELKHVKKRKANAIEADAKETLSRRKRRKAQDSAVKCLFCEGPATNTKTLHQVATFEIDAIVREFAANLQDHNLIAKLSEGDLIALGAAYHTQCLVSLYNRDRDRPQISGNCDTSTAQATAFTRLVSYMERVIEDEKLLPVFKLCDLKKRFDTELHQLRKSLPSETHSTRFKNKFLSHFPNSKLHSVGRDVLLVAKDSMGKLLRRPCELEDVGEELHVAKEKNNNDSGVMEKILDVCPESWEGE